MKTIWKYEISKNQTIEVPIGSEFLCAQIQNGVICVWAEVNTENLKKKKTLLILGTGHIFTEGERLKYIGTVQDPPWVWHIYESFTS